MLTFLNEATIQTFRVLMWKNYLIMRRKPIMVFCMTVIPACWSLLVFVARSKSTMKTRMEFETFSPVPVNLCNHHIFSPLCQKGVVYTTYFTPDVPAARLIMQYTDSRMGVIGFPDETAMMDRTWLVCSQLVYCPVVADVVFENLPSTGTQLPAKIKYTIRVFAENSAELQNTQFMFSEDLMSREPHRFVQGDYWELAFLRTQHYIDFGIISALNVSADLGGIQVQINSFPNPPYVADVWKRDFHGSTAKLLEVTYLFFIISITKDVTYDKECKMKETLKLMGVRSSMQMLSWFTEYFLIMCCIVCLITVVLSYPCEVASITAYGQRIVKPYYSAIIGGNSPFVLFFFLIAYSLSVITFSFAVSAFCTQASVASIVALVVSLLLDLPGTVITWNYNATSFAVKLLSCLSFNVALTLGVHIMEVHDAAAIGVTWKNMFRHVTVDDNFKFIYVLVMLLVDTALYGCIAWYVEKVRPGTYGIPKPWYFPFQLSYWRRCANIRKRRGGGLMAHEVLESISDDDSIHTALDMPDERFNGQLNNDISAKTNDSGIQTGIHIHKLTKVYWSDGEAVTAVNDVSLTVHEGEITGLLGHNGAGKTTLMTMLTGFLPQSSGTVIIYGHNTKTHLKDVRTNVGLCPQGPVVYRYLTVENHLYLFGTLRGLFRSEIDREVDILLRALGLETQRHDQVSTLSAGMRKKLCILMALIGRSKVVILDEPMSGLDPLARREAWDLLRTYRRGRTILMSTHYIDDASHMLDRIAIMVEGRLCCYGTPEAIKQQYGIGYHLNIRKMLHCNVDAVTALIDSHIDEATLRSNVSSELTYRLPDCTSKFPALFEQMEQKMKILGIQNYGVCVSTLEEVFLRVRKEFSSNEYLSNFELRIEPEDCRRFVHKNKLKGLPLRAFQFYALFTKRLLHALRHPVTSLIQLVIPVVYTLVVVLVLRQESRHDTPPLTFNLSNYGPTVVLFGTGQTDSQMASDLAAEYDVNIAHAGVHKLINVKNVSNKNVIEYAWDVAKKDTHSYLYRHLVGAEFAAVKAKFECLETARGYDYEGHQSKTASGRICQAWASQLLHSHPCTSKNDRGNYCTNFDENSACRKAKPWCYTTEHGKRWGYCDIPQCRQLVVVTAYSNFGALHTGATSLNLVDNAILRYFAGSDYSIETTSRPRVQREKKTIYLQALYHKNIWYFVLCITIGIPAIMSSYVFFLVEERVAKTKEMQLISGGVHVFVFWMSNLVFDYMWYMLPIAGIFAVWSAVSGDLVGFDEAASHIALLFALYGWANLPLLYISSLLFDRTGDAFSWLTLYHINTGFVVNYIMAVLGNDEWADSLDAVCLATMPSYCLGRGLYVYVTNLWNTQLCNDENLPINCAMGIRHMCCPETCALTTKCIKFQKDAISLGEGGIGQFLISLATHGLVYITLLLVNDSRVLHVLWYKVTCVGVRDMFSFEPLDDSDVTDEILRRKESSMEQRQAGQMLILDHIMKVYRGMSTKFRPHVAVNGVTVGVRQAECFGLLGTNGAGKTSIFKMLAGEVLMTRGSAYINGHSITNEVKKDKSELRLASKRVYKDVGYCCDAEASLGHMTCREILRMYGRIHGLHGKQLCNAIEQLIRLLLLQKVSDMKSSKLSGGNRRNLDMAVAMIGNPLVVLLDKPTTGMDLIARRRTWDVIAECKENGVTVMLSSHCLEECEALCSRLAIMTNGKFRCLGTPRHLKNKFGGGHTLNVLVRSTGKPSNVDELKAYITATFPGSRQMDKRQTQLTYELSPDVALSEAVNAIEKIKSQYDIEYYYVKQTTLEEIFFIFARRSNAKTSD